MGFVECFTCGSQVSAKAIFCPCCGVSSRQVATPESAASHLDYLDGWRGVAILTLLVGHFLPVPGINLGTLGVDFFFVLSGWLMTRLLFVKHTPIDIFYRRRIARILPAHLVFIVFICLTYVVLGRVVSVSETFSALVFVNNYGGGIERYTVMPFGHIWSLSVEEHSYVLLSLLAVLSRRTATSGKFALGMAALACVAFAIEYSLLFAGPKLRFDQFLHTEVAGFGIFASGFVLLLLRERREIKFPKIAVPLLVLFGVVLQWWSVPLLIQSIIGVGALAIAVNLLPYTPGLLRSALAWKPLCLMGQWSFSLYLWQQPFYEWARNANGPTWLALLCAFAAGLTSYYFVEKPVREFLNRTWGVAIPPQKSFREIPPPNKV